MPAVHFNTRFVVTSKWWFGGGADLTPVLDRRRKEDDADSLAFHAAMYGACAAHEVVSLMRYKGLSLEAAAEEVATVAVPANGGTGGLIAVDAAGHVAMPFSTTGMYRGVVRADGVPAVSIFHD